MNERYKLEMHLHTIGRSPCAEERPKEIAKAYHKGGYNGIICTNHFMRYLFNDYYQTSGERGHLNFYLDGYRELRDECAKYNIDVFLGMEHQPDIYSYQNPYPPHAEFLIYGIEEKLLLDLGFSLFSCNQQELFELTSRLGLIMCESHPYRQIVSPLDPQFMHGVEVYNGHPHHDSHNDLAEKLAIENNLIAVAGSDFHFLGGEGSGVLLAKRPASNAELVELLMQNKHTIIKRETIE